MDIKESIQSITRDIQRQAERLLLYQEMLEVFQGISFPQEIYTYMSKLSDGEIYVEFAPKGDNKDIRPLIHALSRKFHTKFEKEPSYDKSSLVYSARFSHEERNFHIQVSGVVPQTCKVVETVVDLTPEEIERAHREVKTTRTVREIVCTRASGTRE